MRRLLMKLKFTLIGLLIISIATGCSESDAKKQFYSPRIKLTNGIMNDDGVLELEIYNGEGVGFITLNLSNPNQLEIRNSDNPNILVEPVFEEPGSGLLFIAALEGNDQTATFDFFSGDENLGRVSLTMKVPFKLLEEGQEVNGVYNISQDANSVPKQLKIVKSNNQALTDFDKRRLSVLEGFENNGDIEIDEGDDFYLFLKLSQTLREKQNLGLYYFSTEINRTVLVAPLAITPAPSEDCEIMRTQITSGYARSYVLNDGRIVGQFFNSQFRGDTSFFYDNDKLICTKEEGRSNSLELQYVYEGDVLTKTRWFNTNGAVFQEMDHFYNATTGHKTLEVLKYRLNEQGGFIRHIEYTYGEYNSNNLPEFLSKAYINNTLPGSNIEAIFNFKTVYDASGRRIRDSIAVTPETYALRVAYTYHDNETLTFPIDEFEGETLINLPLLKTYTTYRQESGETVIDESRDLAKFEGRAGTVVKGFSLVRFGEQDPRDTTQSLIEFENLDLGCRLLN